MAAANTRSDPIRPTGSSQPTHDSDGALLPGILCLHGAGSNSSIYKIQARRLVWTLGTQFRFIFADGPYESAAGPGVLPVFETCAPFYRWTTYKFQLGEGDIEVAPREERWAIDETLRDLMEENGGVDSFVGVLGFSQGGRLAAGLMLRQLMAKRNKEDCWTRFRFAGMIGAPFPPIVLEDDGVVDPKTDYELLRTVPTVVAWGDADFVRVSAVQMADACEGPISYDFEFEGGHHLPGKDKDARDLADYVLAAWHAAGGKQAYGGALRT